MVKAPQASMFGLHLSAVGAGRQGRFQIRGERRLAILRADWDEQTRVWETSQKVTAGTQKKNNETIVSWRPRERAQMKRLLKEEGKSFQC